MNERGAGRGRQVCSRVMCFLLAVGAALTSHAWAQLPNPEAREAYGIAAALHNAGKYAEAQEPFETALSQATDNKFKVRVYQALMNSYRLLPEPDKMIEAVSFIFEHGENPIEKKLIARSFVSFGHQRGKTAEFVELFEGKLKQDPRDRPALYTLTTLYQFARRDPARREQLLEVLADVEREDARQVAQRFEAEAAQDARQAAWFWKEAANAWLRADDKANALQAVVNAEASGPESRSESLAHGWHRTLGEVYLGLDKPAEAIPHFEQAIKKTTIPGYIKNCQEQLEKARAAAGR